MVGWLLVWPLRVQRAKLKHEQVLSTMTKRHFITWVSVRRNKMGTHFWKTTSQCRTDLYARTCTGGALSIDITIGGWRRHRLLRYLTQAGLTKKKRTRPPLLLSSSYYVPVLEYSTNGPFEQELLLYEKVENFCPAVQQIFGTSGLTSINSCKSSKTITVDRNGLQHK